MDAKNQNPKQPQWNVGNTLLFEFMLPFKLTDQESQYLLDKYAFPAIQKGLIEVLEKHGYKQAPVAERDIN